jgi:hypothetical protein
VILEMRLKYSKVSPTKDEILHPTRSRYKIVLGTLEEGQIQNLKAQVGKCHHH